MNDFAEALRLIYRQVQSMIDAALKATLGNIIKGGKVQPGAIAASTTPGQVLTTTGSGAVGWAAGGGTVTSIGLAAPSSILTVSGSPVTGSGTLTLTLATQISNTVWAGPTSGIAAQPTFRGLVAADIPSLDAAKIASGTVSTARLPLATTSTVGVVKVGTGLAVDGSGNLTTSGGGSLPTVGTTGQAVLSDGTEWIAGTITGMGGLWDPTSVDGGIPYRKSHTVSSYPIGFGGDSITAGTLVTTAPPATCVLDLTSAQVNVAASNQGVSGTTSGDWIDSGAYLPGAVAGWAATGITDAHFMLGTNDAKTSVATSNAQYRTNLLNIANYCKSFGIRVWFSYPPYMGSTSGSFDAGSPARVAGYCGVIDALVDNIWIMQGDTTAYAYFKANTGALQGDLVHPTQAGSDYLAGLWAAAMRRGINARTGTVLWKQLTVGTGLAIVGDVLSATSATSILTTKGDLQGYSSAPARIPAANTDGQVLTEDHTAPTGWASKPLPTPLTALAQLTDVFLSNLQDGDTLSFAVPIQKWINSSIGFGWTLVDDFTGATVLEDGTGNTVISDPLPTAVVSDVSGYVVIDNVSGAILVNA